MRDEVTIQVPSRFTKREYLVALTCALGGLVEGQERCAANHDRDEYERYMNIISVICDGLMDGEWRKSEGGAA